MYQKSKSQLYYQGEKEWSQKMQHKKIQIHTQYAGRVIGHMRKKMR